jgi:hypothetical protein
LIFFYTECPKSRFSYTILAFLTYTILFRTNVKLNKCVQTMWQPIKIIADVTTVLSVVAIDTPNKRK